MFCEIIVSRSSEQQGPTCVRLDVSPVRLNLGTSRVAWLRDPQRHCGCCRAQCTVASSTRWSSSLPAF